MVDGDAGQERAFSPVYPLRWHQFVAFYGSDGLVVALGVSGHTSCADMNIAWRAQENLRPVGVIPTVAERNKESLA